MSKLREEAIKKLRAEYVGERAKGPRGVDRAVELHKALKGLEADQKLGPSASDMIEKVSRPSRRKSVVDKLKMLLESDEGE